MNSRLMNLRNIDLKNINLRDIRSFLPMSRPSFLGIRGLSRSWGIFGLVVLGIGALAYPTYRLIQSLRTRRLTREKVVGTFKSFLPSYRGKHKPHHRKVESGHDMNPGLS